MWKFSILSNCYIIGDILCVVQSCTRDSTGELQSETRIGRSMIYEIVCVYVPRFLGIPKKGANLQIVQRFLGIPKGRCAFWGFPNDAALSGDPQTMLHFPGS